MTIKDDKHLIGLHFGMEQIHLNCAKMKCEMYTKQKKHY